MNLLFEHMLESSPVSDKDKYEILQFFNFLNDEKKRNLIANFDKVVASIIKIKQELIEAQKILLWKSITNIENAVKQAKTAKIEWIKQESREEISDLKQNM